MRYPDADLAHAVERAAPAWETLREARVLVTGGTGFVGRWLVETLLRANALHDLGVQVTVLTRDASAATRVTPHLAAEPALRYVEGDVRDFSAPGSLTHVVHGATAASAALNASRPDEMLDVIVEGTRRALAVAAGSGADRFLFLSSGAVYGTQPPELERVGEGCRGAPDPLDVRSAYAEGKRAAELLCAIAARETGMAWVSARLFAFVGPGLPLDAHFAAGNFLRDALAGGPIRVGGDGTPYRSYLHAADLAAWCWRLLCHGRSGVAYNVGAERAVSVGELARMVAAAAGVAPVVTTMDAVPGVPASRYVPDCSRARNELGLDAWIPLEDAVARTLAWYREEGRRLAAHSEHAVR